MPDTNANLRLQPEERSKIRWYLASRFSLAELRDLAFDLDIDYRKLPHATVGDFSREIVAQCERKQKLAYFLKYVLEQRPDEEIAAIASRFTLPAGKAPGANADDILQRLKETKEMLLDQEERVQALTSSGSKLAESHEETIRILKQEIEELRQQLIAHREVDSYVETPIGSPVESEVLLEISQAEIQCDYLIYLTRQGIELCAKQEEAYKDSLPPDTVDYLLNFKAAQNREVKRLWTYKRNLGKSQEQEKVRITRKKLRMALRGNFEIDINNKFSNAYYEEGIPRDRVTIEDIGERVESILDFCTADASRQALTNILHLLIFKEGYRLEELGEFTSTSPAVASSKNPVVESQDQKPAEEKPLAPAKQQRQPGKSKDTKAGAANQQNLPEELLGQEPGKEAYRAVTQAESLGYKRDYLPLALRLPGLLETAQRLAEDAGANIIRLENPPAEESVQPGPAFLLNRLAAALYEFMLVSERYAKLEQLTGWAYSAARFSDYAGKWDHAAARACQMAQPVFERLENQGKRAEELKLWLARAEEANERSQERLDPELWILQALIARLENRGQVGRATLNRALEHYQAQNSPDGVIRCRLELGKLEEQFNNLENAGSQYRQALEEAKQAPRLEYFKAECCYQLGCSDYFAGDYEAAAEKLKMALEFCEKYGLRYLEARIFRMLAYTLQEQNELNTALNYARKALAIEKFLQSWELDATQNLVADLEKLVQNA